MRFQTEDTIDTSDHTLVLGALERSVVTISLNVERTDGELRVYGIGPSPRPVYARNLTIFRLERAGQEQTRVKIESEFLASALLEISAQEPAVREKIERAMELAKEEVALCRRSAGRVFVERTSAFMERTSVEQTSLPIVESADARLPTRGDAAAHVIQSQAEAADLALHTAWDAAPRLPDSRAAEGMTARSFDEVHSVVPTAGVHPGTRDTRRPDASEGLSWSGALRRSDGERPGDLRVPPTKQHRETVWWKLTIPAAILLLVTGAYLFGRWQRPSPTATPRGEAKEINAASPHLPKGSPVHPYTHAVQSAAASKTSVKPSAGVRDERRATSPVRQTQQSQATQPAVPQNDSDGVRSLDASTYPSLRERLDEWAASMRSTDPAAQASFYADHLDRYFLKTDVNHAFVLRDKQDFLRRGNRVDQFQVEDIRTEDRTDSSARLRLLKHYVVRAGPNAPTVERSVRSELSWRKVDGKWEITEERDFR